MDILQTWNRTVPLSFRGGCRRGWLCCLVLCLCLLGWLPATAFAGDFSWGAYGGLRFGYSLHELNSSSSPPAFNSTSISGMLLLGGWASWEANSYFSLDLSLDMGVLQVQNQKIGSDPDETNLYLNSTSLIKSASELQDEQNALKECQEQAKQQGVSISVCDTPHFLLQESMFVRELYGTIYFSKEQWSALQVGLLSKNIGRAFVLDNYVIGLHLDLNWSERSEKKKLPLRFEFDFFLPDSSFTAEGKKSPVAHLKLSYVFEEDFQVSFFATYLYDGNDLAGKLLLPLWKEFFAYQINQLILSRTGDSTDINCDETPSDADLNSLRKVFGKATSDEAMAKATQIYQQSCNQFPSSSGHHVWLGFQGNWRWKKKLTIEGAGILYLAKMKVGLPKTPQGPQARSRFIPRRFRRRRGGTGTLPQPLLTTQQQQTNQSQTIEDKPMNGLGFLGELQITYRWVKPFSSSIFFLVATGDSFDRKSKTTFNSFMGIASQVRYTNIFFNGGINAYSSNRGLSINGISGKGYITPGASLRYYVKQKMDFKLVGAAYWAFEPPARTSKTKNAGKFYGAEVNLTGGYQVLKWLKPVVQADFFFPGNFFANSESPPPPVHFQLLVGLDFSWPEFSDD